MKTEMMSGRVTKDSMCRFGSTVSALSLIAFFATACALGPFSQATPTATLKAKALTQTAAVAQVTRPLASATIGAAPTGLASSVTSASPPTATSALLPSTTVPITASQTLTQPPAANFCVDSQVTALISNFKSALQTSNGGLLASLVSPTHGMEARLYRNGRVVTYDQAHVRFLFETTFVVDWGPAPGSGLESTGSFHDLIVPALLDVLARDYTLTCNQVQVGGTTYQASWPYAGISFYSAYFPGTQPNGNLDWRTWLLGMHYVNGKPYLFAIMQFQWEP